MIRFRRFLPLVAALVVGAALGAPSQAHAAFAQVDFSATKNSSIVFNPKDPGPGLTGSFSFVNTKAAPSFLITSGGTGTAIGLQGDITGSYNIGAITTSGSVQSAGVTNGGVGAHQFIVYDGKNTFTADVAWIDIFTKGTGGGINSGGTINLTNISYAGTNADLLTLASNPDIAAITFQFIPGRTLTSLTTTGGSTSFSGSVTTVATPAPAGLVLVACAAPCLLFGRLLRRRKVREPEVA